MPPETAFARAAGAVRHSCPTANGVCKSSELCASLAHLIGLVDRSVHPPYFKGQRDDESLRAISAFKPMASRLGSHPASHLFGAESSHSTLTIQNSKLNDGRAGRIRTDDPLPPRQVRYQTALQPVP